MSTLLEPRLDALEPLCHGVHMPLSGLQSFCRTAYREKVRRLLQGRTFPRHFQKGLHERTACR
jgi:hypothetical protein